MAKELGKHVVAEAEAEAFDSTSLEKGITRRRQLTILLLCVIVAVVIIMSVVLTQPKPGFSRTRVDTFLLGVLTKVPGCQLACK